MSKHSKKLVDPGKAADFKANPFAGLKAAALGIAPEPKTAPKPPPTKPPPPPPPTLTAEDRELLRVFGNAKIEFRTDGKGAADAQVTGPVRGRVRLQVQRKGKGGKTVTRVMGLDDLSLAEQMELARQLRQDLGTGAHFDEGVLELHGDLRERAMAWFRQHQFRAD